MSSPDINQLDYIKINRSIETPIYIQLVEQIIKGIQLGYLKNGYKFPGTRQLTTILAINRNTIVKSFTELEAQEWIRVLPNKGTFVHTKIENINYKVRTNAVKNFPEIADFHFEKSILLDIPKINLDCKIILNDGKPDDRIIEDKIPAKNYAGILKRNQKHQIRKLFFEKQFINYLKINRSINCNPENLLIANNQEILLNIICKIIGSNNITIAVPELNYYKSNMIFQANNLKICLIKMNENGIDLEHLKKQCLNSKIDILYIPSNHHYPTTIPLNFNQKNEIELLAKEFNFIILEQDSFFEYYYTPNTILPYSATNQNNKTIYLSQFGDFLSKDYNLGFMIAPADFIAEVKKNLFLLEDEKDNISLQTIGEMINDGETIRIVKKHRKIYKERRDYLCNLLYKTFTNQLKIILPKGGFAIWIEWNTEINLMQLKKDLEKNLIYLPQHCLYQNNKQKAIRVGFASLNFDEIDIFVNQLYHSFLNQTSIN